MYLDPREYIPLKLSIPLTSLSFAIDVFTFILPIAGVAKLNLTPHRKIGVIAVFTTGFTYVPSRLDQLFACLHFQPVPAWQH